MRNKAPGFTLIELLIVVAIIAILAAIAVPNFLEAQTRAKVSRVKSDMRTNATALEAYHVDWNHYPPEPGPAVPRPAKRSLQAPGDPVDPLALRNLYRLTTPVAYLSSLASAHDIFQDKANLVSSDAGGAVVDYDAPHSFFYVGYEHFMANRNIIGLEEIGISPYSFDGWGMTSLGPDRQDDEAMFMPVYNYFGWDETSINDRIYNPTNGTVSNGDIPKFGGMIPSFVMSLTQWD